MDDLSRLSLRELIALGRERLGGGAAGLKTRAEFLDALSRAPAEGPAPVVPAPEPAARAPVTAAPVVAAPVTAAPVVAAPATAAQVAAAQARVPSEVARAPGAPPPVVTRDFFVARRS